MPKIIDKRSPRSTRASLHGIGTLQARLADPKTWSVSEAARSKPQGIYLVQASWLFYMGYREPPHMWRHCTCGDQKPWIPTIPDFWSSDGHSCRSFLFHPMFGAQTCSITTKATNRHCFHVPKSCPRASESQNWWSKSFGTRSSSPSGSLRPENQVAMRMTWKQHIITCIYLNIYVIFSVCVCVCVLVKCTWIDQYPQKLQHWDTIRIYMIDPSIHLPVTSIQNQDYKSRNRVLTQTRISEP